MITTGRRFQSKGSRQERREKRTADNIVFDSILEKEAYLNTFKPLQVNGAIRALQYHPVFNFILKDPDGNDVEVGSYEADYSCIWNHDNKVEVFDVKPWERDPKTGELHYVTGPDYVWQKKLMKVCFGIDVCEI